MSLYLVSKTPEDWSTNKDCPGPHGQSLQHIRPLSHPSIHVHLHPPLHSLHHLTEGINLRVWKEEEGRKKGAYKYWLSRRLILCEETNGSWHPIQLSPPMIRDYDPLDIVPHGLPSILSCQNPLQQNRQLCHTTQPVHSLPCQFGVY